MRHVVGVLAIIGALCLVALAVGHMENNVAEYQRTHACGYLPETGMYRCGGR